MHGAPCQRAALYLSRDTNRTNTKVTKYLPPIVLPFPSSSVPKEAEAAVGRPRSEVPGNVVRGERGAREYAVGLDLLGPLPYPVRSGFGGGERVNLKDIPQFVDTRQQPPRCLHALPAPPGPKVLMYRLVEVFIPDTFPRKGVYARLVFRDKDLILCHKACFFPPPHVLHSPAVPGFRVRSQRLQVLRHALCPGVPWEVHGSSDRSEIQ
eukprot:gene10848-biopygen10862